MDAVRCTSFVTPDRTQQCLSVCEQKRKKYLSFSTPTTADDGWSIISSPRAAKNIETSVDMIPCFTIVAPQAACRHDRSTWIWWWRWQLSAAPICRIWCWSSPTENCAENMEKLRKIYGKIALKSTKFAQMLRVRCIVYGRGVQT